MPEYREARTIGIYLSMPSQEVSTQSIVQDALQKGKRVLVPYLHKNRSTDGPKMLMEMVSLHDEEDYNSLQPDRWGIPTPSSDSVPNRSHTFSENESQNLRLGTKIDLMLMPGVAFDTQCRRLGHGKGFYDFFLSRYRDACADHKDHGAAGPPPPKMPILGTCPPSYMISAHTPSCSGVP